MLGDGNLGKAGLSPRALDAVGMPAALLDRHLNIIEANESLTALLNVSAAELTGKCLAERLDAAANSVRKTRERNAYCFPRGKDGDCWYRLDLHSDCGRTLALLPDVTAEHLLIEHLRFTSRVNDQLLEEAQIGVWRFDPDTQTYLFASALSLGYDLASRAVPIERLRMIQHRDDAEKDAEIRDRVTTVGGSGETEMRYKHANGEWVHLRTHYRSGRHLPSGRYEMFGITQNITPQAVARDAAKTYADRLTLALKAARGAVFEYDYRKKTFWSSTEFAAMIGVEQIASLSDPPLELFAEDDHETVLALLRQMARAEEVHSVDVRLLTKHGPRWVRLYIEVVRLRNGEARRAVGLFIDIEVQKQQEFALEEARQAAEAADRAKSSFLASMSHEIRTPLNGVLGMAQALSNEPLTDGQREQVEIILDSGKMLMALLNDILDLSKIEAGKLEIVRIDDDLRENIERTIGVFQQSARANGVGLRLYIDPDIPARLNYDPIRVRQCVSNLLSNAVKFTEAGGQVGVRVELESRPDGRHLVAITISDTGIGMSAEAVGKLFSAFTQADGSTSRRFGGTGLGLAISQNLARAMNGDISVESEPGYGSSFRFSFDAGPAMPLEAPANGAMAGSLDMQENPGLGGARVLLVDDNAVNRQIIKLFLEPFAVRFCEAENGEQALDALRHQTFDLVLLDVHMPVMDGCETIERIRASRESWRTLPVIALTADAMSGDKERYLSIGMDDYLSKPIDQHELIRTMSAALVRGRSAADDLDLSPLREALTALEAGDAEAGGEAAGGDPGEPGAEPAAGGAPSTGNTVHGRSWPGGRLVRK
jgi:PAS domain S-box-containing protein